MSEEKNSRVSQNETKDGEESEEESKPSIMSTARRRC